MIVFTILVFGLYAEPNRKCVWML